MNQYLIPANTKKGELLFGIFMPVDLVIFLTGVGITLLALIIMSTTNTMDNVTSILGLLPALVAVMLVFPFPNYHNVRTAIGEVIAFYSNRQRYTWRGWCSSYEFRDK